jgi:Kdo2-lipid IVA lauroyltransferase/acyltransferase
LFGASLGQLAYIIGIRRKVTLKNLQSAFPTLPEKGTREVGKQVYRHFGRVAVGFLDLPRLSERDLGRWVHVSGFDVLDQALKEGKGALCFSGHLGNWEIMGGMAARIGYPITFVVARQSNAQVEALIDKYRMAAGIEIVKRSEAVRGVLSAVKRNRLIALMIDQDAHEDGAFVPFFGRLASPPRGPAVFHQRTGSPLIFARSIWLPGDQYRVQFDRFDSQGSTDTDEITARMTAMLEAEIRKTPEQWFWMHRRWKTNPPVS